MGVAAIAVVLACGASFVTARSALLRSVDESLVQASQSPATKQVGDESVVTGAFFELVLANGQTTPVSNVPIDGVIRSVASGHETRVLRSVVFGGRSYRELIIGMPANSVVACATGSCQVATTSAELYVVNITGQADQLRHLVRTLLFVALGGLLLTLLLGLVIARTALHPLEEITNEIEAVAETNDVSHRIAEGGADELGRLRRVFNRLLNSVQSSQALQRQLVLDASHELRTPLTSLRTNAQVLSRARELSPDDLQQLTNDMITQVDELAALITDLGELTRGERSEGAVETLALDDCIDECLDTARTYARIKDITIDVDLEPSNVTGRRDRLIRAISNLLTNAVKFTPHQGHIKVWSRNGVVAVSDSGPGIAEADKPYVFDRFWRSSSARSLPGSGLGLSIVAQVISEMQGRVEVERNAELGGARFTITLPTVESK